jgi:hypothetical protein
MTRRCSSTFLLGVFPSALLSDSSQLSALAAGTSGQGRVILCCTALLAGIILTNSKEFVLFYRKH